MYRWFRGGFELVWGLFWVYFRVRLFWFFCQNLPVCWSFSWRFKTLQITRDIFQTCSNRWCWHRLRQAQECYETQVVSITCMLTVCEKHAPKQHSRLQAAWNSVDFRQTSAIFCPSFTPSLFVLRSAHWWPPGPGPGGHPAADLPYIILLPRQSTRGCPWMKILTMASELCLKV